MRYEDRKALMKIIASLVHDNEKTIEVFGGASELGKKVFKVAQWKTKCKSYFNRYFKTSRIIVVPSGRDIIMNTLTLICSENTGRGFVFKNYNIGKHLELLGYTKAAEGAHFEAKPTSKIIPYIAFIERMNVVFLCAKVSNSTSIPQSLKNIAVMVKYFLILNDKEIYASGVKVIGLLIGKKEKQNQFVKCSFCHLFSPSDEDFQSPITFNNWWDVLESYEGWWNLANYGMQNKLFDDLAANILCFMALQEKGLPSLTDDKIQQFKETYFLYTPQQMDIHFSDDKHLVIQGSYGSGKSLLGLKKLELISKTLGRNGKIIYINFDHKSDLYFSMKKNVERYTGISPKKVKLTNGIPEVLVSPGELVYVCHNKAKKKLSEIFEETVRLNMNKLGVAKINYHLVIEEYDGETLTHDEADKITKLVKNTDLMESNIILLPQPLIKNRTLNTGKKIYNRETCIFAKLKNTFKIMHLEEVLRCSNEICEITKSTQNFLRSKESVFKTEIKNTFDQRQESKNKEKESSLPDVETLRNEVSCPSIDSGNVDRRLDSRTDLDQVFERSAPLQEGKSVKSKIVNKFDFLCEPKQGVDIHGLKPNLYEFSKDMNVASNVPVISLALILKRLIGKNKETTVLHLADDQPVMLRRAIQLLRSLLDKTFSYTEDTEVYLQENRQTKTIFCSNFHRVNGMEFDHVIIVVSQSEYYLKYYLPQVMSRCTYDLNFVLLPKDKIIIKKQKWFNLIFKTRINKAEETVADMMEKLKHGCLVKQVIIVECKACENNTNCYCISDVDNNKQRFGVHTHSDQYQAYIFHLENCEMNKQTHSASAGALDKAK